MRWKFNEILFLISSITAPVKEVITPILFGNKGSGEDLLNKPASFNFFFLASINFNNSPSPTAFIFSMIRLYPDLF